MLLRKMLRDMKNNLSSFISIFIMATLASFVYSGISAEWYGMKTVVDKYYDECKLPDIWLTAGNFNDDDLAKVKALDEVADAELRLSFDSPVSVRGSSSQADKILQINVINESSSLSVPKTIEGKQPNPEDNGLWLDKAFADANNLKPGDRITLQAAGNSFQMTVLGLILHPEYVYKSSDSNTFMPSHDSCGFAFIYTSNPEFMKLSAVIPFNQMLIFTDDNADLENVKKKLEDTFQNRYCIIIDRNSHPSVSTFNNEIEQNRAVGGVFPVVFFLIAALSMFTTMTRITNNQRILIGTLKALGFSRSRILFHYVSYGIWLGLAGGLIGLLTGPLVIPPILFSMQKTIYTLPKWSIAISPSSLVIIFLLLMSCAASSYLACRGQLKEMPAQTLRPKAPKIIKHNPLEKSRLWHSLNFSIQWNIRDIARNRIRSLIAFIGVAGCTALLIFGFGLKDVVNYVSSEMYEEINIYESKLNLVKDPGMDIVGSIGNSLTGQWIMEASIELKNGGLKENGSLTVLDKGDMDDKIRFKDENNTIISLPDEGAAISVKMAKLLNLKIGDSVQWRLYGMKEWKRSKITAIYRIPIGQGLSMSRKEYEEMGEKFAPTAFLTSEKTDKLTITDAIKSIQDKKSLIDDFNSMLESLKMIILILVLGSLSLGSVVLYNLAALSFTEKTRELATLRVLGFFPKQIRTLLQLQNIWLTILGIIIGIPAGHRLVSFMLSTMPDSMDMVANITPSSIFLGLSITFLISFFVNLIISRDIRSINMVAALKSVE